MGAVGPDTAGEVHVTGRGPVLAALRAFAAGPPGILLIEGAPGLGKTTVWRAGVTYLREAGARVLSAAPGVREAGLAHAGLADLAAGLGDAALADLPDVQREALDAALRRGPPVAGADPLAVGLGMRGALAAAARDGPLALAVDDLHWLDRTSLDVLLFVLRRGGGSSRLLATVRPDQPAAAELAAAAPVHRVALEPLTGRELARLVHDRLGRELSPAVAARLAERTAGNPLHALELLRALPPGARLLPGEAAGGAGLDALIRDRIAVLGAPARELLAGLALAARPTPALAEALGPGLPEALAAGVVRLDGGCVTFAHPLLAAAAEAHVGPAARRRLHARLAAALEDPDEAAVHLGLATAGPDEAVAARLDRAARDAARRGAPHAAAELAERAASLTPATGPAHDRRLLEAARHHEAAGDGLRSVALVRRVIAEAPPGPVRAAALIRLASVGPSLPEALEAAEQAVAEAGDDAAVAVEAHVLAGSARMLMGDAAGWEREMTAAVAAAARGGRPLDRARALANLAAARFARGGGVQRALGEEAVALSRSVPRHERRGFLPTMAANELGLQLLYAGRHAEARRVFEGRLAELAPGESEIEAVELVLHLADLELRAGRWERADVLAAEALERGAVLGSNYEAGSLYLRAAVDAHLGRADAARHAGEQALAAAEALGDHLVELVARHALGFLRLSLGDTGAADELEHVLLRSRAIGFAEPAIVPVGPDAVEALVAAGRPDAAEAAAADLLEAGERLGRPWALAGALRGRALVRAARAEPGPALADAQAAVTAALRTEDPFTLARCRLVEGMVLRRARRQADARAALSAAGEAFAALRAGLWEPRAARELGRVGGRRPRPAGELSETEHRVAELVARGRTNKEVAAELFISVKTVEASLSRIFGKLGVRSRAELAARGGSPGAGSMAWGSPP
jgi:DNA-binding NarL/FixJ family response regulator